MEGKEILFVRRSYANLDRKESREAAAPREYIKFCV